MKSTRRWFDPIPPIAIPHSRSAAIVGGLVFFTAHSLEDPIFFDRLVVATANLRHLRCEDVESANAILSGPPFVEWPNCLEQCDQLRIKPQTIRSISADNVPSRLNDSAGYGHAIYGVTHDKKRPGRLERLELGTRRKI